MKIEEIEKVHSIGYRLKDAKVTINQDFKYNVAGVKIEGTQGDTNNMPQWIGKILNDSGVGTIDMPDMITELKQALSKEKMVGEYQLSTLEPHFYIKLKETMKELNRDDFNHVESILLELFRMRRGKIVKLADSIKLNSDIYNQLTVEENIQLAQIAEPIGWGIDRIYDLFPRLGERRKQEGITLSGGEQQMLSIGRALARDIKVLLLDEPYEGLAPVIVDEIEKTLNVIKEQGITTVIVEQNAVRALELADRSVILDTGGVVFNGTAKEVLDNSELRAEYLAI